MILLNNRIYIVADGNGVTKVYQIICFVSNESSFTTLFDKEIVTGGNYSSIAVLNNNTGFISYQKQNSFIYGLLAGIFLTSSSEITQPILGIATGSASAGETINVIVPQTESIGGGNRLTLKLVWVAALRTAIQKRISANNFKKGCADATVIQFPAAFTGALAHAERKVA